MRALIHKSIVGSVVGVIAKRPGKDIEYSYASKRWRDAGTSFVTETWWPAGNWDEYCYQIGDRPISTGMDGWWESADMPDDLDRGLWLKWAKYGLKAVE